MNVLEAAEYLGLSRSTVYELCSLKQLRHQRKGPKRGRIFITREWCDEYMKASEVAPVAASATILPPVIPARYERITATDADLAALDKYRRKGKKQGETITATAAENATFEKYRRKPK